MQIALFTIGGQGDTQPFVALAVRLRQEGHRVTLATRPDFADLVADYGVNFAPLGHPYQPFITGAADSSALGGGHLLHQLRYGLAQRRYFSDHLNQDAWRAAQGAEAIIYKYSWFTGYSIAEKLGIPCTAAMFFPLTPTRAFPNFLIGRGMDRRPLLNRLNWSLSEQVVWQLQHSDDTKLRRELGTHPLPFFGPLARQQRKEMPVYYTYSPAVLPRPADWPEQVQVTGYLFLDPPAGWQPPADLLHFLQAEPPPVSIGFGSMTSRDAQATLDLVLRALKLSGQRGVLLSGWAGLGKGRTLPEFVFCAESLPHSWLFPRMAALVHHGGAGTTGTALRGGVPSVFTPLAADQPSWARLVSALGAGPAPLPFQTLTAEQLAEAIREAVTNAAMRQRATELSKQIQEEDGIGQTIEHFLRYVDRWRKDRPVRC